MNKTQSTYSNYSHKFLEAISCIKTTWDPTNLTFKLKNKVTTTAKFCNISSTREKTNWTNGGVTYQGAISPKQFGKWGFAQGDRKSQQEEQEHGFEMRNDFSGGRRSR